MQYGRRSGILFSSFVIYERERFCFFAAQGAAGGRAAECRVFFCGRGGVGDVRRLHVQWQEVRFLNLPVFAQKHAAMSARSRCARILRDSFMRPRAAWVRGTLGALPRENRGDRRDKAAQIFRARQGVKAKAYWRYVEPQTTRHCAKRQAVLARRPPRFSRPHQGTEFPGPSTFLPPACVRSYEPFHAAIDAESSFPTSKYNSAKSPAYPRPPSASGIPLRPARTEGT